MQHLPMSPSSLWLNMSLWEGLSKCLNDMHPKTGDFHDVLQVSYCSTDCQKQNWKEHKPICPPYKVPQYYGVMVMLLVWSLAKCTDVGLKVPR